MDTPKNLQVLLVDDSEADRDLFSSMLKRAMPESCSITQAATSLEGLALLDRALFDCIILDMMLPDISGLEFLELAKARNITTPIVILTGARGVSGLDLNALKLGASEYLDKNNVTAALLHRVICHAIEKQKYVAAIMEANKLREVFMAVMSHDIKNRINAISGFAKLLVDEKSDPCTAQQSEYVHKIAVLCASMNRLVDSMLVAGMLKQPKMHATLKEFDLIKCIQSCFAMWRYATPVKKKKLHLEFKPPQEGVTLFSDEDKLTQALDNLISNAVKFTESGRVEISVEIQPSTVQINIKDTGIGLSEKKIEQLYAPFSEHTIELGLGFFIAKSLIELLGGSLTLKSQQNIGTQVCISLPRAAVLVN